MKKSLATTIRAVALHTQAQQLLLSLKPYGFTQPLTFESTWISFAKRNPHIFLGENEYRDPYAIRAKALLAEIIKRAIADWVLYRSSIRMEHLELAQEAYTWLFKEDENHPDFIARKTSEYDDPELTGCKTLTSFLSICSCLGLNPEVVRAKAKKMDRRSIQCVGRPVESLLLDASPSNYHEASLDFDVVYQSEDMLTDYESYGSGAVGYTVK